MNKHDESICLMVGKNDPTTRGICQALSSEGITKQEVTETEVVGSHWSGQPGQDLFFNGWKLLF